MKSKILLLSTALVLALTACGGGDTPSSSQAGTSSQGTTSQGTTSKDIGSKQDPTSDDTGDTSTPVDPGSSETSDPFNPSQDKIPVDLDGPVKDYPSPNLTEDQFRTLLLKCVEEQYIDQAMDAFDYLGIINRMGFTYADLEIFFDFAALVGNRNNSSDKSFEAYLGEVLASFKKFLAAFDPDKLAFEGDAISIPVGGTYSTSSVAYSWGINSGLDTLIERATGKEKAQLEAIRDIERGRYQTTTIEVTSADLVMVGRLLKAVASVLILQDEDFAKFTLASMFGLSYKTKNSDDEAYWRQLQNTYNVQKIIQTAGQVMMKLDLTPASYSKLVFAYAELGILSSTSSSASSTVYDSTYYLALKEIVEDLEGVVAGKDLKVLFELLFEGAANYTAEIHEAMMKGDDAGASIIQLYDTLYAKRSAEEKASLANLASIAGLDYQEMIAGLKGIPEIVKKGGNVGRVMQEIFQPVIDKYNVNGRFDNVGLYGSSSGNPYYYARNEVVTANMLAEHIDRNSDCRFNTVTAKTAINTAEAGWKLTELNINLTYKGKTYDRVIGIRYYVLPDVLLETGPYCQSSYLLMAKPDDYVLRNTTKEFGASYTYGVYDRASHSVSRRYDKVGYHYSDLTWTKGVHTTTLEGHNFTYEVYDESDAYWAVSSSSDENNYVVAGRDIIFYGAPRNSIIEPNVYRYVDTEMSGRYNIGNSQWIQIEVGNLQPGQSGEFTYPDGTKGRFYRLQESEKNIENTYFSTYNKCQDGFASDKETRIYVVRRGSKYEDNFGVNAEFRLGFTYEGKNYSAYARVSGKDAYTVSGFDTSVVSNEVKTLILNVGNKPYEYKYIVVEDPNDYAVTNAEAQSYLFPGADLSTTYFRIELGFNIVINGQPDSLRVDSTSAQGSNFGDLSSLDVTTPGRHTTNVTVEGRTFPLSYEIMDVSLITVEADYQSIYPMASPTSPIAKGDYQFSAYYKGQTIDNWYVSQDDLATISSQPGEHSIAARRAVNDNLTLNYTINYTVYEGAEYAINTSGLQFVREGDTYVSVYAGIYLVLGQEKELYYNSSTSYSLTETSHGYHKIVIDNFQGMAASGVIEYYVYDQSDITYVYGDPVADPLIVAGERPNWNVQFRRSVSYTISAGQYGSMYNSYNETAYYTVPENDRTIGTHTATITFDSNPSAPVQATYEVAGLSSKYVRFRETANVGFAGGNNVVSINDVNRLAVRYVNLTYYVERENSQMQGGVYLEDPSQYELVMDTSKPTNGWATGYIVYSGMVFTFQYMIYDPADVTDTFVETHSYSSYLYLPGELKEGQEQWFSGEAVTYGYVNGVKVELGRKSSGKYVTLSGGDVTEGYHTVDIGEGINLEYAIFGLDNDNVTINYSYVENFKNYYAVGEEINCRISIQGNVITSNGGSAYFNTTTSDTSGLNVEGFDTSTSSNGQWRTVRFESDKGGSEYRYFVYGEDEIEVVQRYSPFYYLVDESATEPVQDSKYYDLMYKVDSPSGEEYSIAYYSGNMYVSIDITQAGVFNLSKEVQTYDMYGNLVTISVPYTVYVLTLDECTQVISYFDTQVPSSITQGDAVTINIPEGTWFYCDIYYVEDDQNRVQVGNYSDSVTSAFSIMLDTSEAGWQSQAFRMNGQTYYYEYYVYAFNYTYYAPDGQRNGTIQNGDQLTVAAGGFITLSGNSDQYPNGFIFTINGTEYRPENGTYRIFAEEEDLGSVINVTISNEYVQGRDISFTILVDGIFDEPYSMEMQGDADNYWTYNAANNSYVSKCVDNGSASMVFEFYDEGTFSFNYDVSTEGGWDFLIITILDGNGNEVLRKDYSGNEQSSFLFNVDVGYTVIISYQKDGSASSGRDNVIISNIRFD